MIEFPTAIVEGPAGFAPKTVPDIDIFTFVKSVFIRFSMVKLRLLLPGNTLTEPKSIGSG